MEKRHTSASLVVAAARDLASMLQHRRRLSPDFDRNAQESLIRYLFLNALVKRRPSILRTLFVDFPHHQQTRRGGARKKFDLVFLAQRKTIIECKYVRSDQASTGTRGNLVRDVARLRSPKVRADRFLVLVSSSRFLKYLESKPGFRGEQEEWHGKIEKLLHTHVERGKLIDQPDRLIKAPTSITQVVRIRTRDWYVIVWRIGRRQGVDSSGRRITRSRSASRAT